MIFSVSTSAYLYSDLEDALEKIGALGFHEVELWGEPPHMFSEGWTDAHVARLARRLDSLELSCTVHAPGHGVDISCVNHGIWKESLNQYLETLRTAAILGAKVVVIHGGSYYPGDGRDVATGKDRLYRALDEVIVFAEKVGVVVGLENYPLGPSSIVGSAEAFAQVFKDFESPMFGATLDVGHAFVNGEDPLMYIGQVSDRLKHVHLNDNEGIEDSHMPLGMGKVDFPNVLKKLGETGYAGSCAIEVWSPDDPDAAISSSYRHIRRLSGRTHDAARE